MPTPVSKPRTLYDKIWDDHVVCVTLGGCVGLMLISVDLQATHRTMASR
jgi:hypothetical protein